MTDTMATPVLIITMGVSGCGKSTLGQALAETFGYQFFEADDFHSDEAKECMRNGIPLTDEMREPWINAMCAALRQARQNGQNCVLAYSGLRRAHRQRFRELGFRTLYLFLQGEKDLIRERMNARVNHYMPAKLLDSQFASLDAPQDEPDIVSIDLAAPIPTIIHNATTIVDEFIGKRAE